MSQVKLALQPPPNIDFVIGYPGIPPGAKDRPQAAVKGAVEVRVGNQGVKAKWVKVELKKVETLPGGGQAQSYYDYVGPTPITLWQSSEEYRNLQSQDFPFFIRIPESIPPSIALEKGAGIRYELVATVCTLGKKGFFFRRRKSLVSSVSTTIIVDKHELHATWPIYSQPESRHVSQHGLHLAIERSHTCFGPGDRVAVMAIVKSEQMGTIVLRGFEFALTETIIFRAGPLAGKKGGPEAKTIIIGEQKVPVSANLVNGAQHKVELSCLIPNTHTTTSLNTARHIDIAYLITVKAWLANGQFILIDLPVIVSNWPRSVSVEAVKRIGNAPNLCPNHTSVEPVVPSAMTRPTHGRTGSAVSNDLQLTTTRTSEGGGVISYNTAPHRTDASRNPVQVDEFGYGRPSALPATIDHAGYTSPIQARPSFRSHVDGGTRVETNSRPTTAGSGGGRRRGSATANTRSFLVANMSEEEAAEARREAEATIQPAARAPPITPPSAERLNQAHWPTSEDEKARLYERARADVERVQGSAALGHTPSVGQPTSSPNVSPRVNQWVSAEEEKVRLYNQAQATAKRLQASAHTPHSRNTSDMNGSPSKHDGPPPVSAGAALYQQALSSMSKTSPDQNKFSRQATSSPSNGTVPYYPSAEQEKAALQRYEEAKLAVDRNQIPQFSPDGNMASSAPSYDILYPQAPSRNQSYSTTNTGGGDLPPPFEPPNGHQPSYINEKERLRRAFEAQDAAASSQQHTAPIPYTPAPVHHYSHSPVDNALAEKERLRRMYEAQDAAALGQAMAPQPPPPRLNGGRPPRSPPLPPIAGTPFRPLTAAEEKAQLKARYEAEEQGNGSIYQASSTGHDNYNYRPEGLPAPPPLAPRPPVEYIKETQEEDARVQVQSYVGNGSLMDGPHPYSAMSLNGNGNGRQMSLDMRPFSPFDAGIDPDNTKPARPGLPSPHPRTSYYD